MSVRKELSNDGKSLTIQLNEKFDFSQVQDFRHAYMDDNEGVKEVIIDLRLTEYMDSSALGMLLNMQKTLAETVSDFKIINCRPQISKILKISRFDKKFIIE